MSKLDLLTSWMKDTMFERSMNHFGVEVKYNPNPNFKGYNKSNCSEYPTLGVAICPIYPFNISFEEYCKSKEVS